MIILKNTELDDFSKNITKIEDDIKKSYQFQRINDNYTLIYSRYHGGHFPISEVIVSSGYGGVCMNNKLTSVDKNNITLHPLYDPPHIQCQKDDRFR